MNGHLSYLVYNGDIMPGLGSSPFFPQFAETQYSQPFDYIQDDEGQVLVNPLTGMVIPEALRRSQASIRRNPYGLNPGNVINPTLDYSSLIANANPSVDPRGSLLRA